MISVQLQHSCIHWHNTMARFCTSLPAPTFLVHQLGSAKQAREGGQRLPLCILHQKRVMTNQTVRGVGSIGGRRYGVNVGMHGCHCAGTGRACRSHEAVRVDGGGGSAFSGKKRHYKRSTRHPLLNKNAAMSKTSLQKGRIPRELALRQDGWFADSGGQDGGFRRLKQHPMVYLDTGGGMGKTWLSLGHRKMTGANLT